MTRKAHNVDKQRTADAHFLDKRSYWTHDAHEFLFGDDVKNRRIEIYDRAKGMCEECGVRVYWYEGHMHHKHGGLVGRCTCMHNLAWLCPNCHLFGKHVHVMSGKVGK